MAEEGRDVLVLLPNRERLRLVVGVSAGAGLAGGPWGEQGPWGAGCSLPSPPDWILSHCCWSSPGGGFSIDF